MSDASAQAFDLTFLSSPCVLLPDVILSLSASGLTLTINALNLAPLAGSQFFFNGPDGFAVDSASNGNLLTANGFNNPSTGPVGVLSFSLSGTSVPPQVS